MSKMSVWDIFSRERLLPIRLILPVIIVLVIITVYPFVYNVWQSLHHYYLSSPNNIYWVGGMNYVNIFKNSVFWGSLGRTVYFVGGALLLEFVCSLGLALLLNREFRGKNILRAFLMLPLVSTPIAAAYMWRIMYNPSLGIINYVLKTVGLPTLEWISGPKTAMLSLILVDMWQWTPFMVLILLAGFVSLPQEPFEAAKVDGSSSWQTFRYLTLPLVKPVIVIALLLRGIDLFKTFDTIFILTGGGPIRVTETMNIYTYLTTFRLLNIGYGCSLSMIMLCIIIFVCTLFIRKMRIMT